MQIVFIGTSQFRVSIGYCLLPFEYIIKTHLKLAYNKEDLYCGNTDLNVVSLATLSFYVTTIHLYMPLMI